MTVNKHSTQLEYMVWKRIREGEVRSETDKNQLDGFAIEELQIFSNPRYNSFEAEKLHLLFQSVYFMLRGEYDSSLATFKELDRLFDANMELWPNPPVYYVHHLNEIIYNFFLLDRFEEAEVYLEKLRLTGKKFPALDYLTQIISVQFEMISAMHLNKKEILVNLVEKAKNLVSSNRNKYLQIHFQKLILTCASTCLFMGDLKKARQFISQVLSKGRTIQQSPFYRNIRLMNLIIQHESGHPELVESELKAYKRILPADPASFLTEKALIFYIKEGSRLYRDKRNQLRKETINQLINLKKIAFEKHVFVYFDWIQWLESLD